MTCTEFRALLTDHHGNELLAEVRALFDGHKTDCTHCGYFLESFTFTVRVTRLLPREMPPGLEERLRTAVTKALAEQPAERPA
jgi:hypothetical protein